MRAKEVLKGTGLRAGEEMDRTTWSRKIISHIGDPSRQEAAEEATKRVEVSQGGDTVSGNANIWLFFLINGM